MSTRRTFRKVTVVLGELREGQVVDCVMTDAFEAYCEVVKAHLGVNPDDGFDLTFYDAMEADITKMAAQATNGRKPRR